MAYILLMSIVYMNTLMNIFQKVKKALADIESDIDVHFTVMKIVRNRRRHKGIFNKNQ